MYYDNGGFKSVKSVKNAYTFYTKILKYFVCYVICISNSLMIIYFLTPYLKKSTISQPLSQPNCY